MPPKMESPAAANCGAPNNDLAGALIASGNSTSLLQLQISRLTKLYAINAAMAETLAPLVFLGAMR
jgi:hypothetical protein